MARKRDYAAEYKARQARAKAAGFGSSYQHRVRGVPRGERAAARGHRGLRAFLASLREGDLILCDLAAVTVNAAGIYMLIEKLVIPASGARPREFTLRRLTRKRLVEVIAEETRRGVIFSPTPSLDQRRLVSGVGEFAGEVGAFVAESAGRSS